MEMLSHENLRTSHVNGWLLISLPERLDSREHEQFTLKIRQVAPQLSKRIAIDLSQVRFVSLPSIKFISELAQELSKQGGALAMVSASEKIKRQFDVYGSLNQVRVLRRQSELSI